MFTPICTIVTFCAKGAGMVICLKRGANDLHMVQKEPSGYTATPSSLAALKSRMVYFWCWFTQVVLEKSC